MRVVLVSFGTAGDVFPVTGVGVALRERGHHVTLLSHGYFEPMIRRAGLDFVGFATSEEYLALTLEPGVHKMRVAVRVVLERGILPALPRVYRILEALHRPGETVVAAQSPAFGARVAQERLGIPLATLHTHPFYLRSAYASPIFGTQLPPLANRLGHRVVDAYLDRTLAGPTNAFRSELGLPPVSRLLDRWCNSPQRVIALFPEWFAPRQSDWPPETVVTGFPLFDGSEAEEIPEDARRFLDAGGPPLLFTTASWMRRARRFFEVSVDACRRLGRRGLLLTPFAEQIPQPLPPGVKHFGFIPYRRLLPRCAAFVHHGGIASSALALACGIPQVVVPMNADQPDNARRLCALGVASTLKPRAYRPARVAAVLEELLASPSVAERCRWAARRSEEDQALAKTCHAIESLV